jgi:hypothetical protein
MAKQLFANTARVKSLHGAWVALYSSGHMATIFPGRYASRIEGPFVVFLIGMRVNRLLAPHKWLATARAMGPMLQELYAHPELGFLSAETSLAWRGVTMIQYWRSFDHLVAYAQARDSKHLPAWKTFNQSAGNADASVGVWHETYQVAAGHSECIYANMPRYGLAIAGSHEPATGHLREARARMNG